MKKIFSESAGGFVRSLSVGESAETAYRRLGVGEFCPGSHARSAMVTARRFRGRNTRGRAGSLTGPAHRYFIELRFGPRVAEPAIGLITNMATSAPYEELRLKGR